MSALMKSQLDAIARGFQPLLAAKCWALSLGKKPWDYDRGHALTWSDPDLFLNFWEATDQLYDRKTHGAGLGIFLGEGNRLACIDLDGALNEEGNPVTEVVKRILHGSITLTETSVSGRGLHLFFEVPEGTEPFHLREGISGKDGDFFTHKRFIRLTGNVYGERDYPIRYLPPNHVEYLRENFGKVPAALPEVKPFTGHVSGRSLADRLTAAGIPFRCAHVSPQPFHLEHGGIIEVIETECPNIKQHTTDASPYARFVRCADGLITGRCFHGHCDPEILRAAGTSLTGMLSDKIRDSSKVEKIFQLLKECEGLGMPPIHGDRVNELGADGVLDVCDQFLGRFRQEATP
ncbi:MAG: bifunctional DNA primase/polymerase [Methanoregula sp.]|jgi:hypothetical protein|uniref:bifunctional DNA primase/polymerase n=1 Tax=Methanoregula sp. TaxID=2052170 RepID=UPI003C1A2487